MSKKIVNILCRELFLQMLGKVFLEKNSEILCRELAKALGKDQLYRDLSPSRRKFLPTAG
jgi:hypothetical protein